MSALRGEAPIGLERIVDKALAKSADERYQHIDEMLADLVGIRMDSGYEGPAGVPRSPRPPGTGRRYSGL